MEQNLMLEGDNIIGNEIVYFISVGVICTQAAFQMIQYAFAGINILWRILAILIVLTVIVYDLYHYILGQANDIADEVKRNWREILGWVWSKIKENWRPLVQLCWDLVRENIVPFFGQVARYLSNNFKPALQKLGRFLVTKCRALAAYINQQFTKLNRYLHSSELKRKILEVFAKAAAKLKEIGGAVISVLRIQIPIALRNLLHDFNNGFFVHVEALLIDLMCVGGRLLIQIGQINLQVIEGLWNDVKEKLNQARARIKASFASLGSKIKAAIKENAKKLGQKAITALKNRILHPLWEWAKSDWRKLTRLIWDHMSPRWLRWLSRFIRDELNQHPQVRHRLEEIVNGVGIRVFSVTLAMYLLLMSIVFYVPTSDIKAVIQNYGVECHQLKLQTDIHTVLTPAIPDHQWQAICTNLGVSTKLLSELQLQYVEHSVKMETCLDAFATQESSCWETVVLAVCASPFYDQELAKKTANTCNISWIPFEDLCGAKLK